MKNRDATTALSQIRAWAGEAIFKRGQSYELRGRVRELVATAEGGLVAWVQGSERYATRVSLRADQLASDCTCPYGGTCKHAVAVALAYLNRPEQAPPLPVAATSDPRIALLERKAAAAMAAAQAAESLAQPGAAATREPALQTFLAASTQAELVALLSELAEARIAQTSPAAYQEAALFLRKLRRVWAEHGKAAAWRGYIEDLRAANKRKRRLVETLDALLRERG